jgi:hypothetical protein
MKVPQELSTTEREEERVYGNVLTLSGVAEVYTAVGTVRSSLLPRAVLMV